LEDEGTIELIRYGEFEKPQNVSDGPNKKSRLWHNKLVSLCLLGDYRCDTNVVTMLLNELKSIKHDYVLEVFNLTFDDCNYYFVRGYYTTELRSYLSQLRSNGTPLSWSDKITLTQQVVEGLKNISLSEVYEDKAQIPSTAPSMPNPKIVSIESLELNFQKLLGQKQLEAEFVNEFALNRGRNIQGFDFKFAKGIILRDNGKPTLRKLSADSPIVYIPKSADTTWDNLRTTSLFENVNVDTVDKRVLQIHVPVSTVEYTADVSDSFVKDIESALKISNEIERNKALANHFNYYGNYVVTKFTLGGIITIRDWLNVSDESKTYLWNYIKWGIDCGRGQTYEIFEDVPLDKIPPLEADGEMDTLGDLYNWFTRIYDLEFAKVISYGKLIPSYKLLPDDLQEKLFAVTGSRPSGAPEGELVPNVQDKYEKIDFIKWIALRPKLELFLWDWFHINSIQYGVILHESKLGHGKKAAFKFLRVPHTEKIKTIKLLLVQPQNRQEAYLLENGIKDDGNLDLDNIPFAEHSSILGCSLADFKSAKNQPSRAIYCQIIVNMAKLSFNLGDIKSLQKYSNSVNTALQSNEPYKNLCKIFGDDYGHLLPRTWTVGGVLSKKFESYTTRTLPKTFQHEYDIEDPKIIEKIEAHLKEWSERFKVDTSFFISDTGSIVYRDKISTWLDNFLNLTNEKASQKDQNWSSNWSLVSSEDWTPLYKILKKTCTIIDNTFSQYQIVFNGEELFQKDDQDIFVIRFPGSLIDNNYHIFGAIVKKDEKGDWIKYAYPNFNKNRNIKVLYGKLAIKDNKLSDIQLKCKNLASDCVLVTSIVSNDNSVFYSIKPKAWAKAKIIIDLTKDESEPDPKHDKDGFDDEGSDCEIDDIDDSDDKTKQTAQDTVLKWCIIYTGRRKSMTSENNSQIHSWNSFGDYLDDSMERLGEDDDLRFEQQPQLTLEQAIQQHKLDDGDLLEAWKAFINYARSGDHIALYWIGFYLQYDILTASNLFRRRFYDEAIEEFADNAETYIQAAISLYKKSADSGYDEAQLRYGFGLYSGQGVREDKGKAIQYFRLAAGQDNHSAMYNLAIALILNGNDDERREGENWMIKAAKHKNQKAIDYCREYHIAF
ncbi:18651_t:CDS:2, partial [Dentiscutata erythropus]